MFFCLTDVPKCVVRLFEGGFGLAKSGHSVEHAEETTKPGDQTNKKIRQQGTGIHPPISDQIIYYER